MLRSFALSAAALFALAGTADAACSTKKLAGEWIIERSNACASAAYDCGWTCKGRMTATGAFSPAECFLVTDSTFDREPSLSLKLSVSKKCEVSGTATLEYPNGTGHYTAKIFGWVVDDGDGLRLLQDRETGQQFEVSRQITGSRVAK